MQSSRLALLNMCVDTGCQSLAGEGGHSPDYFWGDEQLVALKVFSELTQVPAVGDFSPKLVTGEGETREGDNEVKERGLQELGCHTLRPTMGQWPWRLTCIR